MFSHPLFLKLINRKREIFFLNLHFLKHLKDLHSLKYLWSSIISSFNLILGLYEKKDYWDTLIGSNIFAHTKFAGEGDSKDHPTRTENSSFWFSTNGN